ncbi:uncharacterized protein LOC142334530 [Convolutriloba macropyga]|uniref:uncharacterized protein LOC142334530 n=1 Tax=Convolutriloba macropyga TaxID=536237 RepID=UPI003F5286EB
MSLNYVTVEMTPIIKSFITADLLATIFVTPVASYRPGYVTELPKVHHDKNNGSLSLFAASLVAFVLFVIIGLVLKICWQQKKARQQSMYYCASHTEYSSLVENNDF